MDGATSRRRGRGGSWLLVYFAWSETLARYRRSTLGALRLVGTIVDVWRVSLGFIVEHPAQYKAIHPQVTVRPRGVAS